MKLSAEYCKYILFVCAGFMLLFFLNETPRTTHYTTNDNSIVQGADAPPISLPMDHSRTSVEEEFSSADVATHLQLPRRRQIQLTISQRGEISHGVTLHSRLDRPPQVLLQTRNFNKIN
jgi:hypothetical protein